MLSHCPFISPVLCRSLVHCTKVYLFDHLVGLLFSEWILHFWQIHCLFYVASTLRIISLLYKGYKPVCLSFILGIGFPVLVFGGLCWGHLSHLLVVFVASTLRPPSFFPPYVTIPTEDFTYTHYNHSRSSQ